MNEKKNKSSFFLLTSKDFFMWQNYYKNFFIFLAKLVDYFFKTAYNSAST